MEFSRAVKLPSLGSYFESNTNDGSNDYNYSGLRHVLLGNKLEKEGTERQDYDANKC